MTPFKIILLSLQSQSQIPLVRGILVLFLSLTGILDAQITQFTDTQLRYNLLQVADQHARQGEWKDAILEYYQFIYRFPQDSVLPVIYYKMAAVYQQTGHCEQAESCLKKALQKSGQDAYQLESQLRWAVFLYEKGEYEASLKYSLQQSQMPFRIVSIYNWVMLGYPDIADSLCMTLPGQKQPVLKALHLAIKQDDQGYKSVLKVKRWQATLAAAVLPGLGKAFYHQYWHSAGTAVGFYSLFKIAQVTARRNSDFFYIAATGLIYYYLGNIYATYHEGGQYVMQLREQRIRSILHNYPLSEVLGLTPALEIEIGKGRP